MKKIFLLMMTVFMILVSRFPVFAQDVPELEEIAEHTGEYSPEISETETTLEPPVEIIGIFTEEPTTEPTEAPAENSTAEPTTVPTEGLTAELTEVPTEDATAEPTAVPTEELTAQPTELPTEEPTAELTEIPTEEPTAQPTELPTEEPTAELTEVPTEEPTVEPTEVPTEEPTAEPTELPTEELTVEPTEVPTDEPTAEPTEVPTEEPTAEPTEVPPEEPTAEPTEASTEEPTAEPTEAQIEEPTETPVPDVIVTITGNFSHVTYSGQQQTVSGYTAAADHPDYDVTRDFVFRRETECSAERIEVGTTYMGLTKEDFVNVNPDFGNVLFDITDGYIEILPVSVTVEIEGNTSTVPYDGEMHSIEGYEIKGITCTYSAPEEPEFTIYDCQAYTAEDFIFTGEAAAEREEAGITNMGLKPDLFENRNVNFETVTFLVTDGFLEVTGTNDPAPAEETQERNVTIYSSLKPHIYTNDEIVLSAHLEGFGSCEQIRYQWECDQGEGFVPVAGGDKATLSYPANEETLSWNWQLTVFCK